MPDRYLLNKKKSFQSEDYRTKPFLLGKLIKVHNSESLGIVYDTWMQNYGTTLKETIAEFESEMRLASFDRKPDFFRSYAWLYKRFFLLIKISSYLL